jgi:hypothetical protein
MAHNIIPQNIFEKKKPVSDFIVIQLELFCTFLNVETFKDIVAKME